MKLWELNRYYLSFIIWTNNKYVPKYAAMNSAKSSIPKDVLNLWFPVLRLGWSVIIGLVGGLIHIYNCFGRLMHSILLSWLDKSYYYYAVAASPLLTILLVTDYHSLCKSAPKCFYGFVRAETVWKPPPPIQLSLLRCSDAAAFLLPNQTFCHC